MIAKVDHVVVEAMTLADVVMIQSLALVLALNQYFVSPVLAGQRAKRIHSYAQAQPVPTFGVRKHTEPATDSKRTTMESGRQLALYTLIVAISFLLFAVVPSTADEAASATIVSSKFELFVHDSDESIAFYAVLGFSVIEKKSYGYTTLKSGSTVMALSPLPWWLPVHWLGILRHPPLGTEIVLYTHPRQLEKSREALVRAGYSPIEIKLQLWGDRDFRITDPDGYYIRVSESEHLPVAASSLISAGSDGENHRELKVDLSHVVHVVAGPFRSGCNMEIDFECDPDELPFKRREILAFQVDIFEVSVENFLQCVTSGRCREPQATKHCNAERPDRSNHPINCVTWHQAIEYCEWLGKRLPTEWEWEKAARGKDGRIYAWGNVFSDGEPRANIADESTFFRWKREGYDDGYPETSPVGQYPLGASPYGALDMIGNVMEWTSSLYPESQDKEMRVIRGGGWSASGWYARTSHRQLGAPTSENFNVGFRCVL